MRNQVFIKSTTLILLLAIFTYVVPVHQLFHKHKANTDYSVSDSKVTVKSHEKPCCKPVQFLKDSILTTTTIFAYSVKADVVFIISSPKKVFQSLFFITNKAPPIYS